jgi:NAD(P)-dependent dehydrogenase (short-subunit alcohol dehydrogenase family)
VKLESSRPAPASGNPHSDGTTSVVGLDLVDLDRVAGCPRTLLDRHDELSALICNAGVIGGPRSAQGFERQMAANHLGHAVLVAELWPLLDASGSRVVLMSSTEARDRKLWARTTRDELVDPVPYDGRQVCRNSKQANLYSLGSFRRRVVGAPRTRSGLDWRRRPVIIGPWRSRRVTGVGGVNKARSSAPRDSSRSGFLDRGPRQVSRGGRSVGP